MNTSRNNIVPCSPAPCSEFGSGENHKHQHTLQCPTRRTSFSVDEPRLRPELVAGLMATFPFFFRYFPALRALHHINHPHCQPALWSRTLVAIQEGQLVGRGFRVRHFHQFLSLLLTKSCYAQKHGQGRNPKKLWGQSEECNERRKIKLRMPCGEEVCKNIIKSKTLYFNYNTFVVACF